jgi:hypothetical protein
VFEAKFMLPWSFSEEGVSPLAVLLDGRRSVFSGCSQNPVFPMARTNAVFWALGTVISAIMCPQKNATDGL